MRSKVERCISFLWQHKKFLQTLRLKTIVTYYLTVGQEARQSLIDFSVPHSCAIRVLAGLHFFLDALRKNICPSSFRLLSGFNYLWL